VGAQLSDLREQAVRIAESPQVVDWIENQLKATMRHIEAYESFGAAAKSIDAVRKAVGLEPGDETTLLERIQSLVAARSGAFVDIVMMLDRTATKFRDCGDTVTADTIDMLRAKVQALGNT
jgi:hypothetical protein